MHVHSLLSLMSLTLHRMGCTDGESEDLDNGHGSKHCHLFMLLTYSYHYAICEKVIFVRKTHLEIKKRMFFRLPMLQYLVSVSQITTRRCNPD